VRARRAAPRLSSTEATLTAWRTFRRSLLLVALTIALAASSAWAQAADLLVEKSGPGQAAADTDVTYTVTLTNLGPDDAVSVTLSDPIPPGMTFVSATPAGCVTPAVGTNGPITCSIALLPDTGVTVFTFVFHIDPATPAGTFFTNIATASSATFDPNDENNSGVAVTSTPPPPQADLGVAKTGPSSAGPNTNVVYTILVTNGGLDPALNLTLSDTLPGTMTFVSLGQSGTPLSCSTPGVGFGGTVTCTSASYPGGGSTTLTLTGHIPSGTPAGTLFANTVTISSDTADDNPENNSSVTALTVSAVDVAVAKTGPASANAGDPIAYTLTVRNNGPDTAVNVQMIDALPPNTTFVSLVQDTGPAAVCSTPVPDSPGTVSCVFSVLSSGAQANFTLTIRAGNTTSITNTLTATTDSFDTDLSNNNASQGTTITPRADLAIVKTGPATVTAGTDASYTVTVTNNGPSDAASVSWTDAVVSPLTFVSLTQTSGPAFGCTAGGTITCTIATLSAGATATFSLVLHVPASTAPGGTVSNTAVVSASTSDPESDNNQSTASATVTTSADAGVVKTGPASVHAGTNITYTVTVTNAGPSDATTVSLTDTVPAGTTFVSENQTSGPTFTCLTPASGGTGTITCNLATLPAGASATFSIVVKVALGFAGPVANTANVGATTPDPQSGNSSSTATTTVVPPSADVRIVKTGSAEGAGNETVITYTIVVTNAGPDAATNVVVTDVLPATATFQSATPTQGSCAGTTTVTCSLGTLASGGSATITLVVRVPVTRDPVSNTASVTSDTADPVPGNNSSTVEVAAAAAIPTLSSLTFALLGILLGAVGMFALRARRPATRS
jgi:uncharacterized repeat protein (TIGR01451 family)